MAYLYLLLRVFLALSCVFVGSAKANPQPNQPLLVGLRIEGNDSTIYEAPILTKGHTVSTASGGTHHCDGTNNGTNPLPGATCTSALDDASKLAHFQWDGTFSSFDDYLITSIGDMTETATQFWGILLNFQLIPVGGCQQEVKVGDEVLFAFDAFNKAHFLKLSGPATARAQSTVTLTVTDGSTGSPIRGADVDGNTSDENGHVSIMLGGAGLTGFKAERSDSIRSNKWEILVLPQ